MRIIVGQAHRAGSHLVGVAMPVRQVAAKRLGAKRLGAKILVAKRLVTKRPVAGQACVRLGTTHPSHRRIGDNVDGTV